MRKVERRIQAWYADLCSVWYEEVPSTGFDCIMFLVFLHLQTKRLTHVGVINTLMSLIHCSRTTVVEISSVCLFSEGLLVLSLSETTQ